MNKYSVGQEITKRYVVALEEHVIGNVITIRNVYTGVSLYQIRITNVATDSSGVTITGIITKIYQ